MSLKFSKRPGSDSNENMNWKLRGTTLMSLPEGLLRYLMWHLKRSFLRENTKREFRQEAYLAIGRFGNWDIQPPTSPKSWSGPWPVWCMRCEEARVWQNNRILSFWRNKLFKFLRCPGIRDGIDLCFYAWKCEKHDFMQMFKFWLKISVELDILVQGQTFVSISLLGACQCDRWFLFEVLTLSIIPISQNVLRFLKRKIL